MKRILTLALALVIALGAVAVAKADGIEVQFKGQWLVGVGFYDNKNFYDKDGDGTTEDPFNARQRFRTQMDFIASESLSGTLFFEIGTNYWGRPGSEGRGSGSALDADGVNIETKRAFINWVVPGMEDLTIRMGIQSLQLPSATGFGNPVMRSDVAGIVANYKFNDNASLTAFWARPFDAAWNDAGGQSLDDETDMLGLMLPLSFDGFKVTPWVAYAKVGANSGLWSYRMNNQFEANANSGLDPLLEGSQNAWWAGIGFDLNMFDPLSFRMDFIYGRISGDASYDFSNGFGYTLPGGVPSVSSDRTPESKGWFVDAVLDYKMDWATAGLFGWYASGDDEDDIRDGELGRMPIIGTDMGFAATSFGMCGGYQGFGYDKQISRSGIGTWGIGLHLKDIKFIDDLKTTVRFAVIGGTNDKDIVKNAGLSNPTVGGAAGSRGNNPALWGENIYMTTGDYAYEVNLLNTYKIYDNFEVALDLAWIHLELDDVWQEVNGQFGDDTSDSWKAEVLFLYSF